MNGDPATREAMNDPERKVIYVGRPMWKQGLFWVGVLAICISVATLGYASHKSDQANKHAVAAATQAADALRQQTVIAKQQAVIARQQAQEAKDRLAQLQHGFCGLLNAVGSAKPTDTTSALGHTLIAQGRIGAQVIDCPPKATP